MRGSRVWKYSPTQAISPTQVLKQASIKMAASSTSPALPNSRSASTVSTSAPVARPGQRSGVPQHGIDHQQQPACHKTGTDGTALHVLLPGNALRPDVHGDDRAKVQCGKGVHGLVTVQYAL